MKPVLARLAALMYHDVVAPGALDDSGFAGAAAGRYKLDSDQFERHLVALADSGIRFPALDQASTGDCLLTFDDGGVSFRHIADMLASRGMVGHFFIATAHVGTRGFLVAEDIRALLAAGHRLGSHSHSHPANISLLRQDALEEEWRVSAAQLADWSGQAVDLASVPGGFYSQTVAASAAKAGIQTLFTSEPHTRIDRVDDCSIHGRYALWRGMGASEAVALATGAGHARLRQWAMWNGKKPLKRFAGPLYRGMREMRARLG